MRNPSSTYRLQLHAGFGFDAASEIADYLQRLGISHVYSSPYLQAMPGSMHGYDVSDHHRVNRELGGERAHELFCQRLGECGLGQVLDIVPNHMAIGGRWNTWWWDVLENGVASRYASYFDIDWQSPEERLRNKVMLPILGDHYGRVLKKGEIRISRDGAEFTAHYHEHELPIAPESTASLLATAAVNGNSDALAFLADSLNRLSLFEPSDRKNLVARHRDKEVIRRWLGRLAGERPEIAAVIDAEVEKVNASVDLLDALLERQNYRVAFWKTASRDLGYRRFFDINTLVGMRMEDRDVFEDTHSLILEWLRRGILDGVRIDHPDGLREPREYFRRLREAAPNAWIVAEKILEPGEQLRQDWPIQGTTGYDFLNLLGGVFVNPAAEETFTRLYQEFTSDNCTFAETAHSKKQFVLRDILGSDVNRLTALFQEICERNRDHRDYTRHDIHHAIRELVSSFPIYRTYIRATAGQLSDTDIKVVDHATETAIKSRPDLDSQLFDFLHDVLLLRVRGDLESEFVMRFQQFTGPAMAKGVEDTAFYAYNRFIAMNEVGGDPSHFSTSLEEFHSWCEAAQQNWPETQLAGSTHDTKRSEDVRARLYGLSEIPEGWCDAVWRWSAHNEKHRNNNLPDRNTEYFLYQTLAGTWPITADRLLPYMEKACREAKQNTNWTNPNETFETAMRGFVNAVLNDREFLYDFEAFLQPVIETGYLNSLSQTLVRMTAPGVPDLYQGTELWDFSLVDPDNRRPVDYQLRRSYLEELETLQPDQITARMKDGLPKLWTVRQSLQVRRNFPESFGKNSKYTRLSASGPHSGAVLTYLRGEDVVVVAPRFNNQRSHEWKGTSLTLPEGNWNNVLGGGLAQNGTVSLADLLAEFPVALLTATRAGAKL